MKPIKIFMFLLIPLIFLASCKNESAKNETKEAKSTETKRTETSPKEPITGFLFFRKGMSYSDAVKELNKRNIKFNEDSDCFVFDDVNIKSFNSYQNNLKIKVIKGESLKVLDYNMKDFELNFINDSLVIFKHNLEGIRGWGFTEYDENKLLMQELNDALNEKYGPPTNAIGKLYEINEGKYSRHFENKESTCNDYLLLREWCDKKTQVCISIKKLEHEINSNNPNNPIHVLSRRNIFEIFVTYDESLIKKVKNAYRDQMILQKKQQDKSNIEARKKQLEGL